MSPHAVRLCRRKFMPMPRSHRLIDAESAGLVVKKVAPFSKEKGVLFGGAIERWSAQLQSIPRGN